MKVLGVVGPGADDAADRLAERLDRDGRVARIERGTDATTDGGAVLDTRAAADTTYALDDHGWSARGTGLDLDDALDRLAPAHDYTLVVGFPDADLPAVAVGTEREGALVDAPDADALDVGAVVNALADVEPRETLESLIERAKAAPDANRAGAVATFTGRVREKDADDDAPTTHLRFEKYEGVAEETMAAIARELETRDGVVAVRMHHRTGVIEAGEDIVFVVVLAGHREAAFRTVEDGIDRLKDEVPIFKKEVTLDGEFWVHER